jgi:hypothetical protein
MDSASLLFGTIGSDAQAVADLAGWHGPAVE